MKVHSEIFKAYDIRGIYPDEINKEIAFQIGRTFCNFLNKDKKKKPLILVGKDNRLSSDILFKAVKDGIKIEGNDIIDINLSTTPMFHFGVQFFKAGGGIMITASHNAFNYNGFKLAREKGAPFSDAEIKNFKRMVLSKTKLSEKVHKVKRASGRVKKKRILKEYIKFSFKSLDQSKNSPLKIVIDTANGVCGILIPALFKKLKRVKIYPLCQKLDGEFPKHDPDPSVKENLNLLQKEVLRRKADFGVAFDGDGDRIIFVDEKGKFIRGDLITALMAKIILREKKGEKILYELTSSKIVKETIEENGGVPVESRVGSSFIHKKMREEYLIFGGEISGHYYFRGNHCLEHPLFVLFKMIEEISRQNTSISKIVSPFRRYISSGVMNFKIDNKIGAIKKVENYFKKKKGYKISSIDGIKVEAKDFWFLVRPSNTEPLLRLSIEANNRRDLNLRTKEVKRILGV